MVNIFQYANTGDYIACLGTDIFKCPWRVNFGGFLAKDEQKPKLVSAHPKDLFVICKMCDDVGKTILQKVLYNIIMHLTFSQIRNLNFDFC